MKILLKGVENKHIETYSVTHLKGTVKQKKLSCGEKRTFLVEPFRYPHPYHCRSFIRFWCQSSLHQSPIGIKVIGEALYPLTLSAFWRTRKSSAPCRVQVFVQVLWLLTIPKMARGMGSKDADNDIQGWDGYQSGLVVLPTL
jgi:hypothetical protein